ncbi:MAG: Ribosomal silencing factor RsfS [uncultured Aureispira sp.]|uniref:Ribosomal silencing factor RsfS n=1 Tax=uncultured Aureispira sp. TaxID=1331704 RepID=A0A6S6TS76_9BACT|nr:MAG: Ribosomal silencing factor RsfS [uncultured Aureispira sp.]
MLRSKNITLLSNKDSAFQQDAQDSNALTTLIIDAIQDNKGKEIALFDMRQLEEASSEFFILCNGNSKTQILGILKNIERRVYEEFGIRPNHSEGQEMNWMLLDYFSVVVHIFSGEKRAFYNLDDLWSDAKVTKYDS